MGNRNAADVTDKMLAVGLPVREWNSRQKPEPPSRSSRSKTECQKKDNKKKQAPMQIP